MIDISKEMLVAVNSSAMGVVIADNTQRDKPIIYANPAFTILTGYEESDILGKNCRFLQGKDSNQDTIEQIRSAVKSAAQFEGKILNYRKDGSKFWNKLTINPVVDNTGAVTSFIGIQEDVTSQVIRETQQDKIISQLEDFAALIAHDLKAPVRHIREFLKLYIEEQGPTKTSHEAKLFLNHIFSSTSRATEIIDNTLEFTRNMEYGLEREPVNLNRIANKAIEEFELDIKKTEAIIKLEELPTALGHQTQIYQVFQNLIGNALKYRAPNRQCQIHIYAPTSRNNARVDIKDNGIGIPKDEIKTVFSAYKRARNVINRRGSGIGLATVQRIMQSYGGKVLVASEQSKGSTFSLLFPKTLS